MNKKFIENFEPGTAPSAVKALQDEGQALKNLNENNELLHDLVDLTNIFKVSKRTLYNWRAKKHLDLFEVGGKLYMSHNKLVEFIVAKEGGMS